MAGDASFSSVALLLHGDGANGSTTFTDHSATAKTATAYGNAQISTAQSKYGGASIKLDGAGDYLTFPDSADFALGSADFTVECWFYESATGAIRQIVGQHTTESTPNSSFLLLSDAGKVSFSAYYGSTAVSAINASAHTGSAWHHVAGVRDGTTIRLYLDGVHVASASIGTNAVNNSSRPLCIGTVMNNSGREPTGYDFNGHIDDLRITPGVARYTGTGSFTPPAAAFPDQAGEISGVIRDDAGAVCARTVRIVNRSTGALIASTTSDAGTGAYLFALPSLDEVQRIVLDDSGGTLYNDIIDRVIPA